MRWTVIIAALVALELPSSSLRAQATANSQQLPDSSVWRPILEYVVRSLSPYIARAATDTTLRPWNVRLPSSEAPWPMIENHFRSLLRARSVTNTDSIFYRLEVGPLSMVGDTARVNISIEQTKLCPGSGGRSGGYGNRDNVYVHRVMNGNLGWWSSARSDGIIHGDRFGC
jgi:hypothetical protein